MTYEVLSMKQQLIQQKIQTFKDLDAWQNSRQLSVLVYRHTKVFPPSERFGLASQSRRSAVSVSSNIAEGFSRKSKKDKVQFYQIALGSVTELQSQWEIAYSVKFVDAAAYREFLNLSIKVHKLINGLIKSAGDWHVVNT